MARLSTEKLAMLKRAFTEDAMTPGQAAQKIGVTYGHCEAVVRQVSGRDQAQPGKQTRAEYGRVHKPTKEETKRSQASRPRQEAAVAAVKSR